VSIVRSLNTGFDIQAKTVQEARTPQSLSSGESELISLAIEILAFTHSSESYEGKTSYLFLDEPDVHLHPDLQGRLINLLIGAIDARDIVVVIATHSTAILGALSDNEAAHVGFVSFAQSEIDFVPIGETLRKILPIFGAHPLSNVFNKTPILLVEGEDDERIWQAAVRSSQGKIKVWPCATGDIQSLNEYEDEVEGIASAVYENATAFSVRDRDEAPYEIDDKPIVKRMRLFCRTAENLLLSDDVLKSLDMDWEMMMAEIDRWLLNYPAHPQFEAMKSFKIGGFDRLNADIKAVRNVFMMLAGSQKPWEVAVGQAIARLLTAPAMQGDNSLPSYLGPKLVSALNLKTA
jgi:hypothetical protein